MQKTKAGILAVDTLKQNGDFAIQMTQASPQIQLKAFKFINFLGLVLYSLLSYCVQNDICA